MSSKASKVQFISRGWGLERPLSYALIGTGALGLYSSINNERWKRVVEDENSGAKIGLVESNGSGVRVKHAGGSVWQDLSGTQDAIEGDSIYTDSTASAKLRLKSKDVLEVGPGSLVIARLEKSKPAEDLPWWQKVAQPLNDDKPKPMQLEVKKGTVQVGILASGGALSLTAGGQKLQLKSKGGPAQVRIQVDGTDSAGKPIVKLQSAGGNVQVAEAGSKVSRALPTGQAVVAAAGVNGAAWKTSKAIETPVIQAEKVTTPKVVGPIPGTELKADAGKLNEVTFSWEKLPPGIYGELEVRSVQTTALAARSEGSRNGASVSLPLGSFDWRVRARAGEAGQKSEWTSYQRLDLVESLGGRPSITQAPDPEFKKVIALAAAPKPAPVAAPKPASAAKPAFLNAKPSFSVAKPKPQATWVPKAGSTPVAVKPAAVAVPVKAVIGAIAPWLVPAPVSQMDRLTFDAGWMAVGLTKNYVVTVFKDGVQTEKETTTEAKRRITIVDLNVKQGYQFQVQAMDANGKVIAESPKVAIALELGIPKGAEPVDGAEVAGSDKIILTWSKVPMAEFYDIEIAGDPQFKTQTRSTQTDKNFVSFRKTTPGTVYWRLRAKSGAKNSQWSAPRNFKVK
ncbi:MAG: hypothetical protein JNL01_09730 [Bdellovibrionales bacterium]|nr:hypothetical protein [Bdellovibrionales bacterium]